MSPLAKKLAWGLGLSLAINLFLLGFGVARRVHPPMPGMVPTGEGRNFDPAHVARLFGPHSSTLRAQRKEVQRARSAVVVALTAEPFKREDLAQALEGLRAATHDGQKKLHDALLEAASNTTAEERALLARSRLLHDVPKPGPGGPPPRGR